MDSLLTPAYKNPLPIDKNKHKDLMNLCQSEVIPKEYHLFYKTLISNDTTSNNGNSDVDCIILITLYFIILIFTRILNSFHELHPVLFYNL